MSKSIEFSGVLALLIAEYFFLEYHEIVMEDIAVLPL
jgi:hypothetical protein